MKDLGEENNRWWAGRARESDLPGEYPADRVTGAGANTERKEVKPGLNFTSCYQQDLRERLMHNN